MLQQLIHSAKVKMFESARFYYGVLVVLTSYFLLNRFLQKLSFVYLDNRWIELKIGEGILFGLAYGFMLISAWCLRKKIPRYVFWCWGGLILLFFIHELRFAWENPEYSLVESLTKSQGYYTAKFTMPLLFWGVWSVLKEAHHYGRVFIHQLQRFLTINAVFILAGAVFGVSTFESYPLSGRWGYSGLLWHLSFHSIVYGIFLLYLLEQQKKGWLSIGLFGLALLLLGQKAGLLYVLLIFTWGVVTNRYFQLGILASGLALVCSASLWLPYVVSFSPFWENVYNKHGVWGVLLSLRNENIENIWGIISPQLSVFDVMFGGAIRFPMRVEMMPFDILIYFGVLGLLLFVLLLFKILPHLKWSIPILVACFGGGIYEAPLGMLLFLITVALVKQDKYSYSP
jgi:hypothetical protein